MNEILINLIIAIGVMCYAFICYAFLVGLVCFYWGRYNGYLARVKDERENKHYRTKEEFEEYKKESLKRKLP